VDGRGARPAGVVLPALGVPCTPGRFLCDSAVMAESPDLRRRDPAWLWYALAAAALVALLILDATGVLDRLGP